MKRSDTVSHSSWNWELISDQALEIWLPDLEEIKKTYPDIHLIIIGNLKKGGHTERLIQDLGIKENIFFNVLIRNLGVILNYRSVKIYSIICDKLIIR